MQNAVEVVPQLGLAAIFTLLFVTLGPIKLLGPFAQATRDMDAALLKRISLLMFLIGSIAAVAGGLLGRALLASWQISIPAITLAGGLIFFLVGLRMVMEPYSAAPHPSPSLPAKPLMAACQLALPLVVTPYGLAAVIALLAHSTEPARAGAIIAIVVAVMIMNLLSMLYIRHIVGTVMFITLQIFGAMLAVLQLALSVQIMLRASRMLGLIQ